MRITCIYQAYPSDGKHDFTRTLYLLVIEDNGKTFEVTTEYRGEWA